MIQILLKNYIYRSRLKYVLAILVLLSSCTPSRFSGLTNVRKPPADRPYIVKNTIEVKGGNFSRLEKEAVTQRLEGQLDDSSKLTEISEFIILTKIVRPPAYDSGYSALSARNMLASMYHIGYYNARVTFDADTSKDQVHVKYTVEAGKPTLIDTLNYRLRPSDLQDLAMTSKEQSILVERNPVTKAGVLGEVTRLVDTFRNNGYYKFTAAELKVRGDTTIEALTTVSDDPFEQLRLLAEAQQQRDSPTIRLAIVINPPSDSTKLRKYYINKVYILPDYRPGDQLYDTTTITQTVTRNFIIRYHNKLFKNLFLARNVTLKEGDTYGQDEYYKTINNFSNKGVWQSINIKIQEVADTSDLVDLIVELIPGRKFGFEFALEASYSATSNTTSALAGNLFGLSGNLSLLNRNFGKEAIRMTNALRAGVELNNNARAATTRLINSLEFSYTNNIVFPRLVSPFPALFRLFKKDFNPVTAESFINTNLSYNNRLDLFDRQAVNIGFGSSFLTHNNWKVIFKPVNIEFSYLNRSDSFNKVLLSIPFLRYSYNDAFIVGMSGGVSKIWTHPRHLRSLSKESSLKINVEESGMTWGAFPISKKYKRKYIKADVEYKYTVSYRKTALAMRGFIGVGAAFGSDTTLPFFKQYFGGGSNSMRGWPVRGIGGGSQRLVDFRTNLFNDRTADMQFETNIEYRYDIARIIPNTLTLRGAIFTDIGNIWNLRNSKPDGSTDSTQFKLKNFYKELGVAAGTGFRLDFNYFILRFDFGFRFKRPELAHINDGWKVPYIGFDDFFPKLFGRGDENRRWRYENFNFTIGISYPF